MAIELFSTEFNFLKDIVAKEEFHEPLNGVMSGVKNIFSEGGFDESCSPKLELMRGLLTLKEDERILQTAGIDPAKTSAPNEAALKKAASVKFLRHLYLTHKRGNQKVWCFSSPDAYRHYPSGELDAVKSNVAEIKSKLKDKKERFSSKQRAALGEASTTGLAWCQKTNMALASASSDKIGKTMSLVRRWFADSNTTEEELNKVVSKLADGFKRVTATINSNELIFTDMASVRGATTGKEKDLYNSYAFVASGRYEKIPIVYIENAFFSKNTSPLPEKVLWALTVVHEITHLDMSTKDHKYDYEGLKPGTKITCEEAKNNADSWAYFCADCAGVLSESHVNSAMNGW